MAITVYTLAELEAAIMGFFRVRFPSRDLGTEGYLGKEARAWAMALLSLQKGIEDVDHDASPSNFTSTAQLDAFAILFGLTDGDGGYGRKQAVAASGGEGPCTGVNATNFPDGTELLASDGVTVLELSGSVTVPGAAPDTGSVDGVFIATTTGTAGNLPVGSVLTWVSTPAGGDSTVTLTVAFEGGIEIETDAALLQRIYDRLQKPPKGGTASDYRVWAEAVTGVLRAYCYPLRGGIGTVHVVIAGTGSGTSRDPGASIATDVTEYIDGSSTEEGQRPVPAEGYTTLRPYMPAYPTASLTIRCRMSAALAKYNFDWVDTAATYTVGAYTGSSPATLELSAIAPATLKAAIDAGSDPRVQVLSTTSGASAANPQARCTGYVDGGGVTTLTLENPLPAGFTAPTVGDRVFAGGPGVETTAAALLDYVDGLGPSRTGTYADALDGWEDVCAIARLTQIALDAADTDDVRFFKNIISGGVTIAVGNGAAAATDATATDATSTGPELLYARTIAVTQ